MRKAVVAALTTITLLAPVAGTTSVDAAPASGPASSETANAGTRITGTWKGLVRGDHGAEGSYSAKVRIFKRDGRLRGRIVAGGCIGRWRFDGRNDGTYRFTEILVRERAGWNCVKRVKIKAFREGAKLRVNSREPRSGDTATMLAHRV